jgi:hypothetical protein
MRGFKNFVHVKRATQNTAHAKKPELMSKNPMLALVMPST